MKCIICGNEIETSDFCFMDEYLVHTECKEEAELNADEDGAEE